MKYRKQSNTGVEDNVFWTTLADLMLGLAIVFMTMFVFAMMGFGQAQVRQQQAKTAVSEKIDRELRDAEINVEIDKMSGDLKIADVELFDLGSSVLTDKGKRFLDKLAPIYINSIFDDTELTNQIEYIIIQGHTDSQMFAGVKSKDEQFLKNMDLSLKRANSVAEYIFKTNFKREYSDSFRKKLVIEGKSFNEPVVEDGVENYDKSRRVVLRLKVKSLDVSTALGLKK